MDMMENPNYYFVDRPYKSKFICTDCRKVFKRRILSDIAGNKNVVEKEPKCPDCGKHTSWIGPKFRAPKSENLMAWKSIKILNDMGMLDFKGFASVKVTIPETSKALNDLLIELREQCYWAMKRWSTLEYAPENKQQIAYLSERIKRIDNHFKKCINGSCQQRV